MSVSNNALCSLEEVQSYYFLNSNGTFPTSSTMNDKLEDLINRKSTQLLKYVGIDTFLTTTRTEYYDGNGTKYLFLKYKPVNSIASIYDDTDWEWDGDSLIAATDYRIVGNRFVVLKDDIFTTGDQNIKITYSSGYSEIPGDVKQACIEEIVFAYENANQHRIGLIQKTIDGAGSVQYYETGIMKSTTQILNKYKSIMVM